MAEIEKDVRGLRGELKAGARTLPATTPLDPKKGQRPLEDHGGDLDVVSMGTYRQRPTGHLWIHGEIMQEDGPMCDDDGFGLVLKVTDTKEGSNGIGVDVQSLDVTTDTTPLATCPNMYSAIVPDPRPKRDGIPETYQDILIQTPTGERVPEHEIQWGPNPHRRVCGDTSQLLEIVPGHHHFKASHLATDLCNLVKTDLRSQFYKTPSTRESSPTSEPLWSLGKERTINSQKLFASRRQAWVIGDKEKIAD